MGGLLTELGKKLAERWLSVLVLPGALYLAAMITAVVLGHGHPFEPRRLTDRLSQATTAANAPSAAGLIIVLLIGFLLAAAACGLAAQALGAVAQRLWLAVDWQNWPPPLWQAAGALTRRRRVRWDHAMEEYQRIREEVAAARALAWTDGTRAETPSLAAAYRPVSRISAGAPERPTWMGDRLNGVSTRLADELDLDLAVVWPYLWLAAPDTTRSEITAARESLDRATTLAGWGLLYLVVGAFWWPCLLVAVVVMLTAWRRGRAATDTYALLIDATVRMRSAGLAQDLGLPHEGPLTRETGWALTTLLRNQ
ncbi:hypothetical protein [Actinocrispum sp. NPDC049592]|uniref:hypothetical protein n=1 Tax=Actinocrispum sp. NPDC049592 TaxID=3154835 RepID=UPI003435F905